MVQKLALLGGQPACTFDPPKWPIFDESEKNNLNSVLESGNWFSGMTGGDPGSMVYQLQEEFSEYQGIDYVAAVSNGTAAIEIALRAAGIGPGDEVIVPSYTFIATASAVSQVGAVPVIVDVRDEDLFIDPEQVRIALSDKTRALIPVHVGGQIGLITELCEIADEAGLVLIEDCAHAHGSVRFGEPAGAFGVAGTFSFQHSKTSSGGEGGLIATNDREFYLRCVSLRSCGRTIGGSAYEHSRLGWNYRMTEWQAAIIRAQLSRAKAQLAYRQRSAAFLRKQLQAIPGFEVADLPAETLTNNHYYFIVKMPEETVSRVAKGRVIEALKAEGVPVNGGYPWPIGDNAVYDQIESRRLPVPVAKSLCERVIVIPHYLLLGNDQYLHSIVKAFEKVAQNLEKLG